MARGPLFPPLVATSSPLSSSPPNPIESLAVFVSFFVALVVVALALVAAAALTSALPLRASLLFLSLSRPLNSQ